MLILAEVKQVQVMYKTFGIELYHMIFLTFRQCTISMLLFLLCVQAIGSVFDHLVLDRNNPGWAATQPPGVEGDELFKVSLFTT